VDLDWIATTVTRRTGLTFPTSRIGLLQRAVDRWLATADEAARTRVTHRMLPTESAWRRLISLLTVGETYFFRHSEQLDALRREILPDLIRGRLREGDRRLRVWCAGCATGEEAYTLAMLLVESLPDAGRWDIRVLGTDIDEEALGVARAATYGRWALRIDGDYLVRWLRHAQGGREVEPAIRSLVRFAPHNLVGAAQWPPAELDGPADLILCRNVLMYMAPPTARQVLDDFRRALAPGGWLLLGPAEPAPDGDFVRRSIDGFVISQRPAPDRTPASVRTSETRPPAPANAVPAIREMARRARSTAPPSQRQPAQRRPAVDTDHNRAAVALTLADAGRLDEAETIARQLVRSPRPPAAAFALLAAIAEARGDLDAASHALGRALYLAPNDPMALFRLGLVEWRRARLGAARSRMRGVLAALEPRDDADLVDPIHGITAGAMRGVARSLVS
jgi:chemotaxis protein methyltransferase CheR